VKWREPRGEVHVASVDRQRVLHEVIRADAEERHLSGENVGTHRRGRRFHHHAKRQIAAEGHVSCGELRRRLVE